MSKQFSFVLVDDSDLDVFINQKFLQLSGMAGNIHTFTDVESALDLISHKDFSAMGETVVLLDLQFSGNGGFYFLDAFSKLDESTRNKIYIYMLSSTVDEADLARAASYSCLNGILPKPLDLDKLKKLLSA